MTSPLRRIFRQKEKPPPPTYLRPWPPVFYRVLALALEETNSPSWRKQPRHYYDT